MSWPSQARPVHSILLAHGTDHAPLATPHPDAWMDREEKKLTPEEEEEAKKLFFTVKVRESRESDEGVPRVCQTPSPSQGFSC